jgi:hypothetical protein
MKRAGFAGLLLVIALAWAAGATAAGAGAAGPGAGIAPAGLAQQPTPTPDVGAELDKLSREAQQKLDQLSNQAQSQIDAQGRQVSADFRQRLADQANQVIEDITLQVQHALQGKVAQVCGTAPGVIILGLGLVWWSRTGRRRP